MEVLLKTWEKALEKTMDSINITYVITRVGQTINASVRLGVNHTFGCHPLRGVGEIPELTRLHI